MLRGQIDGGRTFAGGVHRRHQGVQGVQDEPAEGAGLADQVRPAAQPARVVAVGRPAIAHQPAGEAVEHVFDQLLTAPGDVVQGHGQRPEHPQPQGLVVFGPRGFVRVQQLTGQHRLNQFLFRRRHGGAGFVERLMDRADAQLQPQPLAQEFPNPRPRQPEPVGQRHDQGRQSRPHQPPFAEFDSRQQRVHYAVAGLGPGPVAAGAGRFVIAMVHHPQG